MMRRIIFAIAAVAAVTLNSCKTTEANYRAAYEVAKEKQLDGGDSTVTAGLHNELQPRRMVIGDVTLPVRTEPVVVSKNTDVDASVLKVYNVAAASFKQLFNAASFRDRLRAHGFDAFLVNNRSMTYYVIAATTQSPAEAAEVLSRLASTEGIILKQPFPYVLRAGQLVR